MKLSSEVFEDEGEIPAKYTCDGRDISPPLSISELPSGTESLALVIDDPDAPGAVFDHWVIWNIPANLDSIPEDVPKEETVESLGGAIQGLNGFGKIGYKGPCPPPGPAHNYRFIAYALDTKPELTPGLSKKDLEREIGAHTLAQDQIVGIYGR